MLPGSALDRGPMSLRIKCSCRYPDEARLALVLGHRSANTGELCGIRDLVSDTWYIFLSSTRINSRKSRRSCTVNVRAARTAMLCRMKT